MEDKLKAKLSKGGKIKEKQALTREEVSGLLKHLESTAGTAAAQNRAMVFMLVTSGLRASELLQLTWSDIEEQDGKFRAVFKGKGDKGNELSTQELFEPAIDACRKAFIQTLSRKPKPEDRIFWTAPTRPGEESHQMEYHALYMRVRKIGKDAVKAGVIKDRAGLEFSPHLFRRSYATGLYFSGMKIKAIQHCTRHRSVKTLMDHYIKDEEPAGNYMADWFNGKT